MSPLPRRALLLALIALPMAARAEAGPTAPVQALLDGLAANAKAGKATPFAARAAKLGAVVDSTFDLPAILLAAVGPRFNSFAPDAQAALLTAFRDFTVASWVANFDTDEGQRFELNAQTRAVGADQVVSTAIVPKDGDPTRLDYVMRNTNGSWKAVDILVDGAISRVAIQRSDFRTLLKDGTPGPLIDMLKGTAADLAR